MEMRERETEHNTKSKTEHGQGKGDDTFSTSGRVTVVSGIHRLPNLQIVGKTVSDVLAKLKDTLNIGGDSMMVVNGKEVDGNYILKDGDTLEFPRAAGQKG